MFLEHKCNTTDAITQKNEAKYKSILRGTELQRASNPFNKGHKVLTNEQVTATILDSIPVCIFPFYLELHTVKKGMGTFGSTFCKDTSHIGLDPTLPTKSQNSLLFTYWF